MRNRGIVTDFSVKDVGTLCLASFPFHALFDFIFMSTTWAFGHVIMFYYSKCLWCVYITETVQPIFQAFVKTQKTKAYFERFQVKFKRRRRTMFILEYLCLSGHSVWLTCIFLISQRGRLIIMHSLGLLTKTRTNIIHQNTDLLFVLYPWKLLVSSIFSWFIIYQYQ